MPSVVNILHMLAATGVVAMGFVSRIETPEMKVGLSGLMVGLYIWGSALVLGSLWTKHRIAPLRRGIPDWVMHLCVPVMTGMIMLLLVVVIGFILTVSQSEAIPAVVCTVAFLTLVRVSRPLTAESITAIRALAKRREYA